MPVKINGLPAHVLLIHVVIVLLPLAALMLVAGAVWPVARARLGFLTPATALVALVFVPVTTNAGKWLRDHLGYTNAAVRKHTHLGGALWPWAVGIFVMAAAVWVLDRRFAMTWRSTSSSAEPEAAKQALPVWVSGLVTVLAIVVSVGGVIQLYRIGDSGAHAAWPAGITH